MSAFTIHGTRGTMPASGPDFDRYGGHTSCFSLAAPGGLLIFDAGTGIQALAAAARARPASQPIAFFFTHFHLDHIMGLPTFKPLYDRHARLAFWGPAADEIELRGILARFVGAPYWPVNLRDAGAEMTYTSLNMTPGSRMVLGAEVAWHPVSHPSPCLAYRVTWDGGSVALAVDREQGEGPTDARFLAFCEDADVLIHDAHYTEDEYPSHRGWGHSTWRDAARVAQEAAVRRLILTHHDPARTDPALESILEQARAVFPNTDLARQGFALKTRA
jgi:ribonuclease Z